MATWLIRGGFQSEALADFLETGSVGIDFWTRDRDLTDLSKSEIRTIILHAYPKEPHSNIISWFCNQTWNFIHSIQHGDTILMPTTDGRQVHVGRIVSSYYFVPGLWYPQRRAVAWTDDMRPSPPPGKRSDQRTVIAVEP